MVTEIATSWTDFSCQYFFAIQTIRWSPKWRPRWHLVWLTVGFFYRILNVRRHRYRTSESTTWNEVSPVLATELELKQLTAGERYQIQINTASHRIESATPIQLQHTLCQYPVHLQNCVLLGFTGFYWVLLGSTGFYCVLLRILRVLVVLLGSTGSLLGCSTVVPSFTGYTEIDSISILLH